MFVSCYARTVVKACSGLYIPVYVVCVDVADQIVQVLTLGFAASPLTDVIVGLFNLRIAVVDLYTQQEREKREREKGERCVKRQDHKELSIILQRYSSDI